jgi:hypothetical protein
MGPGRPQLRVRVRGSSGRGGNLKGAFIQIMPLTWDSFLLPVMDSHLWQNDLMGSTSGLRRGSPIQDLGV